MAKQIRQLPIAPDSANPATFNARADAFVKAMQPFADDANALARELEEFSANVDTKSADVDTKYADLVQKYNDFITKYGDFFAKYDIFVPAYLDVKTKHGETVSTAKAHKEYVDTLKTQIDEALERAKSFINSGNGGIIDDTKTAETSTFSSTEIVRRLNLKADDATAYREWNYKEISDDYVAQNNDALFVNTKKPITITLPSEGKIKIIDKAGNFSKFNVKLADGGEVFVLNKDFQKLELFKFNGEWRAVNGSLIRSFSGYGVSAKSVNLFSDGESENVKLIGDFLLACGGEQGSAVSLDTMTNVLPAMPTASGFTTGRFFFLGNDLCVYLYKNFPIQIKLFAFDTASKRFVERDVTRINQKLSANYTGWSVNSLNQQNSNNLYFFITKSDSYTTYCKLLKMNSLSDISEVYNYSTSKNTPTSYFIFGDILLSYVSNILQIPKNLITKDGINIDGLEQHSGQLGICIDWERGNIYFYNSQKTKAIEVNIQTKNAKIVPIDANYTQTKPVPKVNCDKQDAYITKDGLFFTDYQNFRKVTSKISVTFNGADKSAPFVKGNKNYIVGIGEMLPKNLIEVTFTPKTFQEEI